MRKKRDLYYKYITGTCTEGEREEIIRQFKEYNIANEEGEILEHDSNIKEDLSQRLLSQIQYEIFHKRNTRIRLVLQYAVASIFVFGLLYFFVFQNKPIDTHPNVALDNNTIINENLSDSIQNFLLPDRSNVKLYPNSKITYSRIIEPDKRSIFLEGKAIFKVSKDASRPFTVYSGQIATTALGTLFKVERTKNIISVQLYEGKILVKKIVGDSLLGKRYYLLAGNAIDYNIKEDSFTPIFNVAGGNQSLILKDKIKENSGTQEIVLDDIPMPEALDKIAQKFNVEIEYSPTDVEKINIIATINTKQPVQNVLHNISAMNNLQLIEVDNKKFILQKSKRAFY